MVLWLIASVALTAVAFLVASASGRRPAPDDAASDLECAVLTVLSVLVTPIVWPHYYVVLVMPIAMVAFALGRLVVDGGLLSLAREPALAVRQFDRRRRLVPGLALVILAIGVAILSTAHYVEPWAGNGGQQLTALLLVYGASLVALLWVSRRQGVVTSPAEVR
jgi:uncharacterized membrane protein YvlD (DUF360 family)